MSECFRGVGAVDFMYIFLWEFLQFDDMKLTTTRECLLLHVQQIQQEYVYFLAGRVIAYQYYVGTFLFFFISVIYCEPPCAILRTIAS